MIILGQETPSGVTLRFAEELSPREKDRPAHEMKRHNSGVSPQGNGNCEAARSEAGMSYELCIVRIRESTEGRKMGGSVGV